MQMRERMELLIEEMLNGQILLNEALLEFEKIYIQKALKRYDEHVSNTASALGIHRNTLSKKTAAYQTDQPAPKRLLAKRAR
ncbi:MAG TPA: helix-turn-helix domain-containing protein [Pyrinomonadaceae bacterium]|nr:helix-turn-helix domain-containing protein [Pyrinomonadaceae bacterium]